LGLFSDVSKVLFRLERDHARRHITARVIPE